MTALIGHYMFAETLQRYLGETFQLGVPGGILIGLIAAVIYHRVKHIQLPEAIQFFGGPRLVPLFMGPAVFVLVLLMIQIGPLMNLGMQKLTDMLLSWGGFGTFLYGIIHRLLVPSGLHHVFNNFFSGFNWALTGTTDSGIRRFAEVFFRGRSDGRHLHGRIVPDYDVCASGHRPSHHSRSARRFEAENSGDVF